MSRILTTRYDNSRCKACNKHIPFGTSVRHSGGYGVTCLDCPHTPGTSHATPANGTPISAAVMAQLVTERDALLSDGRALRTRIGELAAEAVRLRESLATAVEVARDLARENAALKADRRVGPLAQLPIEVVNGHATPESDGDDCPI